MINVHNALKNMENKQRLIHFTLKLLKKKNKSFHSCFTLQLPLNGMIEETNFMRLSKKFVRKIQRNQLYFAIFCLNPETNKLQIHISISQSYSPGQIKKLDELWQKILLKENALLLQKDVKNCMHYAPIKTTFEYLEDFFDLERLKVEVIDRLGKDPSHKMKIKGARFLNDYEPFYGSNLFATVDDSLHVLRVRQHYNEIMKRHNLHRLERIEREKREAKDG